MLYVQSSLYLSNRITETRISIKISKSRKKNKKSKARKKNTTFIWMELLNLSGMLIFSHVLLCFLLFQFLLYNIVMYVPIEHITKTHTRLKRAFFAKHPSRILGYVLPETFLSYKLAYKSIIYRR